MAYFPFFVELSGKQGLIVGGGSVALRKIQKIKPYGAKLTVVAGELLPEIEAMEGLCLCRREFLQADIHKSLAFVIAATNDTAENHKIAALCRQQRIPVNVVDDPAACTFLFPALVRRGSLSVGICTGGASPVVAAYIKEQIALGLPEGLEKILDWLAAIRPELIRRFPNERERAMIVRTLYETAIRQGKLFLPEDSPETDETHV